MMTHTYSEDAATHNFTRGFKVLVYVFSAILVLSGFFPEAIIHIF
jgi:hypothetical protein